MSDELRPLSEVLADTDRSLAAGRAAAPRVWATGFDALDTYLGGGVRSGELTLLGGPQGLGKTTFVLQLLRNVVAAGGAGLYFSFEHDATTVLERLVAAEAGHRLDVEGVSVRRVREAFQGGGSGGSLAERLGATGGGSAAVSAVRGYAPRLLIHRSGGSRTDVAVIRETVRTAADGLRATPVVVVDYLQKVAPAEDTLSEEQRVSRTVEGLKDLALELGVALVAVSSADREGLVPGRRLRINHLRGASALAYESDVVLVLNDKYDIVARHHIMYGAADAERFRDWVVLSIEKNRSGLDGIDLEFRKRFDQARFDPHGRPVAEQLADARVHAD